MIWFDPGFRVVAGWEDAVKSGVSFSTVRVKGCPARKVEVAWEGRVSAAIWARMAGKTGLKGKVP